MRLKIRLVYCFNIIGCSCVPGIYIFIDESEVKELVKRAEIFGISWGIMVDL